MSGETTVEVHFEPTDINPYDPPPPCPFCDILHGVAPARVVAKWDDALAIVPLNPVTDGHVLIIPSKHVRSWGTDPAVSAAAMARAAEYATEHVVGAANVVASDGADATQTVWHLHLHVVPRHPGDGLKLPWSDT